MEILAYIFAAAIGISLGLIGAGGSILTVPVLVYMAHVEPVLATGYSLFVVGSTALVGAIQNSFKKRVDFKTVLIFGITSIATVYSMRAFVIPNIPDHINIGSFSFSKGVGMIFIFAVLMVAASFSMIKNGRKELEEFGHQPKPHNYALLLMEGIGIGILTGLVGAGGGFLIIPALVLLAGLEMKVAIGTSLLIIAMNSLVGFIGGIHGGSEINWTFLVGFTACSVSGIFIGSWLHKFVDGQKLKSYFGWFVLIMGIYIILRETVFQ